MNRDWAGVTLGAVFAEVCRAQHGIVSREQALSLGLTPGFIRARLSSGRWQPLGRGIYATFTGPLSRMATLWAVVLRCGEGATLSHLTAAELHGIVDNTSSLIHVTIPDDRRLAPSPNIVVHHSARLIESRHPTRTPPQTRIDDTVLDLAAIAATPDQAIALMSAAVGRRLTTIHRLRVAVAARTRVRWRREVLAALSDIESGSHSLLEVRYLRDVERAHALPTGRRQARASLGGGHIYRDVRYDDFSTVVELDGRVAHPIEQRTRDGQRDNIEAIGGGAVLHYGWSAVTDDPCTVAAEVARALNSRGWPGHLRRCKRNCVIR